MKALHEPKEYVDLLARNESWLKARVNDYISISNLHGSHQYARKFCSASLPELTKLLTLFAELFNHREKKSDKSVEQQSGKDPVPSLGQMHFNRKILNGIPEHVFLFFLKQFRQACFDLFEQSESSVDVIANFCTFAGLSFDRIEILLLELQNREWQKEKGYRSPTKLSLRMKNNSYHAIFTSLFTPIILLNEDDIVIDFNREADGLLLDLKKKCPLYKENDPPTSESLQILIDEIDRLKHSSRKEAIFEIETETPKGSVYFKVLLKKNLDADNKYRGIIIMFQDLTEQHDTEKRLQEAKVHAEEADKLKTSFLANMSHEIRTPMNAIVGFTELLLNENYKSSEQKDFLKLIRKSSKDLLHIIEDIIDIAKLESKQLKIKFKPCVINLVLEDLNIVFSEVLRRYGAQNEVELKLVVDEKDRDLVINTDGERLKQVLTNLLSNAAKFTNAGTIQYGFRRVDKSNLLFFVEDTGCGIPENLKERVFDRFFQLEEHQSNNLGGAGLGLAICRNIINLLGGQIWIESELNKGSSFYFQMPCHEVPSMQGEDKKKKPEIQQNYPDLSGKIILIAEDDKVNYRFMEEILLRTGADILWAQNGLEAINQSEITEKIDLILMDMKMPEVNGFDATKYIHSIRPEIPIIAQTAFALDGDKNKSLEAGCCAYLTKPIDLKKLFVLIERYVLSSNRSEKYLVGTKN